MFSARGRILNSWLFVINWITLLYDGGTVGGFGRFGWEGGSAKVALSFWYQPHREGNDYIKEL